MTEAEAKMKWCPMVRNVKYDFSDNPRLTHNLDGTCVASHCMMWRWDLGANPGYDKKIGAPMMLDNKTEGHCGLAGKL